MIVDKMVLEVSEVKKILLCIFIGLILSIVVLKFYYTSPNDSLKSLKVYVLQLGRYNYKENAYEKQKEVKNSIVVLENGSYLVLAGVSNSLENLQKIEAILQKENIPYYEKEMQVLIKNEKNLEGYNLMLENALEEETVKFLNRKMLESVKQDVIFN